MFPPADLLMPDIKDLSAEYDVRARVAGAVQTLAQWAERGRRAREAGCQQDVSYGSGEAERLDFFPAQHAATPAPLLVFFHGGFWQRQSKEDFCWVAPSYAAHGINVAVAEYPLAAQATSLDHIVAAARACVAWLYEHKAMLGFDPQRMVVAGHSAGGHLAAMTALTPWSQFNPAWPQQLLSGAVVLSPLSDLAPLARVPVLEQDFHFSAERIAQLSPARLAAPQGVAVIGAVGGQESEEFQRQLRLLERSWASCWHGTVDLPQDDHLSICEAFADPAHPLHQRCVELVMKRG